MPYLQTVFQTGIDTAFRGAFLEAESFWNKVVLGGAESVTLEQDLSLETCGLEGFIAAGETIEGVRIFSEVKIIDGPSGVIASSGACIANGEFPMVGVLQVDSSDTAELVREGNLIDVVKRQMGIVLGLGSQWERRGLVNNRCTGNFGVCRGNPTFTGRFALQAFSNVGGEVGEALLVSNERGVGTWNAHWREDLFSYELFTGFLDLGLPNPVSEVSIAALKDIGYSVNFGEAEQYFLPSPFQRPFGNKKVEMFGDIMSFDMVDFRSLSAEEEVAFGNDSSDSEDDGDLSNEFAGLFSLMIIGFIAMAGLMYYNNKRQTAALQNFARSMKVAPSDGRVGTKNELYREP